MQANQFEAAGTAEPDVPVAEASVARHWRGAFEPYSVGDPGRAAAAVRPKYDWSANPRPDTVVDGIVVGEGPAGPALVLRAASVRGLAHRHAGKVRQDAYGFRLTDDGRYLVAVVSDGVSSGKNSQYAADTVALEGSRRIADLLASVPAAEVDWASLLEELGLKLIGECRRLGLIATEGLPTREAVAAHMAATVLAAVVELRPAGEDMPVTVFALGDSAAWVLRDGTEWRALQKIAKTEGAVASASVRAIPLRPSGPIEPIQLTLRPCDMLMLVSDGVGDPLQDGTGPVGRFLADVWARPPAPLEFAAQVDFARFTQDDDRTALALWPMRAT